LFIKTGEAQGDWHSFETLLTNGSSEEIACDLTEEDEASILYTSGTTGNPKGVVFTNRSILTIATTICIELEMKPTSRILHMMPLSHSAPLHDFLISGTYVGATHVLASSFSPEQLLQKVDEEKITHFFGAPVAYLQTIRHPDVGKYDLTSMKHWVYGGGALSQHDVRRVKETFSIDHLICFCGPTETGPNGTILTPDAPDEKEGSSGNRAGIRCEIQLVDEVGTEVETGEIGATILRGEANMKGHEKEEEKANVVSAHPDIIEGAVGGVPHPDWGEAVKAVVVPEKGVNDVETLCRDFLEGKTAHFKVPRLYEVIDSLPRNATGKVDKNQLRKQQV